MEKLRWAIFIAIFVTCYALYFHRVNAQRAKAAAENAAAVSVESKEPTATAAKAPEAHAPDTSDTVPSISQGVPEVPAAPPQTIADLPTFEVSTGRSRITFSALGGVPVKWLVNDPAIAPAVAFRETSDTVELIPQLGDPEKREYPLSLEGAGLDDFNHLAFTGTLFTADDGAKGVRFAATLPDGLTAVKSYTLRPDGYRLAARAEFVNATKARIPLGTSGDGIGWGWQGGFMDPMASDRVHGNIQFVTAVGEELRFKSVASGDEAVRWEKQVGWAGIERKYFVAAMVPDSANPPKLAEGLVRTRNMDGAYQHKGVQPPISVALYHPGTVLEPGQAVSLGYTVYAGPKSHQLLESLKIPVAAGSPSLSGVTFAQIPLGMSWVRGVCLLMVRALHWLERMLANYGLAIIALTLGVRIALYPLTHWAILNQAKMMAEQAIIKPHLEEINKKFKNDPQRKQAELMRLYREHNINPFGMLRGCLPVLLQMPIFIALYVVLDQSFELRGHGFLWIKDLSQPDRLIPFSHPLPLLGWDALNILPFLMAFTQYISSKMMSSNITDETQRQMMVIMPFIFIFILYNIPSGLVLYWVVGNIWTIGQTALTKRYVAQHTSRASGGGGVPPRGLPARA